MRVLSGGDDHDQRGIAGEAEGVFQMFFFAKQIQPGNREARTRTFWNAALPPYSGLRMGRFLWPSRLLPPRSGAIRILPFTYT